MQLLLALAVMLAILVRLDAADTSAFAAMHAFSDALPPCQNASDFLLVVGDVSSTSARILFEPLCAPTSSTPAAAVHARLKIRSPTLRLLGELRVTPGWPRVLHVSDLAPSTPYNISFDKHKVTFSTLPSVSERGTSNETSAPLKLLFVSCDRWLEDADNSFVEVLVKNEAERFGVVHIGDQIYADAITRHAASLPRVHDAHSIDIAYAGALAAFRDMYRRAWSRSIMKRVLRVGAHYMLPDDHDVTNNLDPRVWLPNATRSDKLASRLLSSGAVTHVAIAAGRQAFFEYQYQLQSDWQAEHDALALSESASAALPATALQVLPLALTAMASENSISVRLSADAVRVNGNTAHVSARQLLPSATASTTAAAATAAATGSAAVLGSATSAQTTPFPAYFARQLGAAGILFLDLRFQRTFHASLEHSLLGLDQLTFVRQTIQVRVQVVF